ncbi:MAG: hypothetical protein RLY14_649 [Planctomycetota bacterium]
MVDLSGHSAEDRQFEPEHISQRNARYGVILFTVYLILYAIFVLLNTFWPEVMDAVPFAGLNLSILYGFGLIAMALVLALVYSWLCRGVNRTAEASGMLSSKATGKDGSV